MPFCGELAYSPRVCMLLSMCVSSVMDVNPAFCLMHAGMDPNPLTCKTAKNNVNQKFLSFSLRYNCLDKQAAILESAILKSNECQVKKLL